MEQVDTDRLAGLAAAVRLWNARAGGVYQEARGTLREAQERLDQVLAYLDRRRAIDLDTAVARAGAPGAASRALADLEEALAAYHVELQTLLAQADRALASGKALALTLRGLQDPDADPIPDPPLRAAAANGREAALEAEAGALRRELEATRVALQAAQAAPRALSAEAQRELARLRGEVAALREAREDTPPPPPGPGPLPSMDTATRLRGAARDD